MSSEQSHVLSTSIPPLIISSPPSTTSTPQLITPTPLLITPTPPLDTSIPSPGPPSPVISTIPPSLPIPSPISPAPPTNTSTPVLDLPPLTSFRPLTTDYRTIPAQIHYIEEDSGFPRSFVFVRNVSLAALDLATNPYAFGLAVEHNEKVMNFPQCKETGALTAFFSYPWRREFPRYYHRNPSKRPTRHFPSLDKALSIYERRALHPVVLLESRTIPTFFNMEEMILPGAEEAKIPRSFPSSNYLFNYSTDHFLDALDLWDQCLISITVHTDCLDCTIYKCKQGTSHLVKFGECSPSLMWGRKMYERHLVMPSPGRDCGRQKSFSYRARKLCRRYWILLPPLLLLTIVTIIIGVAVSVASFAFSLTLSLNSISGGAILGAISARFKLNGTFNSFDRRVCPAVHVGALPCVIPANPDVAGIGGRLAVYIQTISLITLLALNPKDAAPSRFALAITSFAFGVSSLLSALANQLSLYHMILAAKFQTLTLVTASIVEIRAPPYRAPYLFFVNRMRWVVNSAIILWYSLTSPCFGNQPSCNVYVRSQSYFSIGQATQMPARMTAIFNVVSTLLVLAIDLVRARQKYVTKLKRIPERDLWQLILVGDVLELYTVNIIYDNTSPLHSRGRMQSTSLPLPATTAISRFDGLKSQFHRQRQQIVRAFIGALPYPKFQRYLLALMAATLLISNIETTITLNAVGSGENSWTYGQILAVVLTIPPVVQVWQLLGLWLPEGLVKSKQE